MTTTDIANLKIFGKLLQLLLPTHLFISESKLHPWPARLFIFRQKSTLDMISYVVNYFFHPARLFKSAL